MRPRFLHRTVSPASPCLRAAGAAAPPPAPGGPGRPGLLMSRILVVDDDAHVARTLVDLLGLHDYAAVPAGTGERALELLEDGRFDLVMLDLRLPGIDGGGTCARIRERFGASLPVLMLTALPDPAALRQAYEAG